MPRYLTISENREQFGCYRAGWVELAGNALLEVVETTGVVVVDVKLHPFSAHVSDGAQFVV